MRQTKTNLSINGLVKSCALTNHKPSLFFGIPNEPQHHHCVERVISSTRTECLLFRRTLSHLRDKGTEILIKYLQIILYNYEFKL